jgi:hypothetical protein
MNQTQDPWICSQELSPLDHRGGQSLVYSDKARVSSNLHCYVEKQVQLLSLLSMDKFTVSK